MAPTAISAAGLEPILNKMRSHDADLRLMALIDLQKDIQTNEKAFDETAESTLIIEVVKMVEDSNSGVKNMAVNTLSTLISRSKKPKQVETVIASLSKSTESKDDQQRDIADTALKKILTVLPLSSPVVPTVIDKVSAEALRQIKTPGAHVQHTVELIDMLSLMFARFPSQIIARDKLQETALPILLSLLSSPRQLIRKRSTQCLAALAPLLVDKHFASLNSSLLTVLGDVVRNGMDVDNSFTASGLSQRSSYANLIGSLAKSCTEKIARELRGLMPCLLKLTEELDDEDALEAGMTTLETLVLRCPTEITPYLNQIAARAAALLKYDPNYAPDDDDDGEDEEEMDQDEASEVDDEEDDVYDEEFDQPDSDEEDSSWKARRSAAKLIHALISTRAESLPAWYNTFAPLLTKRLSEREESVRMEIFADWEALLKQTAIASGTSRSGAIDLDTPPTLKRKRQESNGSQDNSISESSPLNAEFPALIKAVLKEASNKSAATKERSFALLTLVMESGVGGLEHFSAQIALTVQKAFDQIDHGPAGGGTGSALVVTVLTFLGTYFERQSASLFSETLPTLVPHIVKCTSDKYARISVQAFSTASRLAQGLRAETAPGTAAPFKASYKASIESLFTAAAATVEGTVADAGVRNAALITLGNFLVHEGDSLEAHHQRGFGIISDRLESDVTRPTALEVIGAIADSELCRGSVLETWLVSVLDSMPTLIRRSQGSNRAAVISSLQKVLARIGNQLSIASATALLSDLKSCLGGDKQDTVVLPHAMHAISQIMTQQPKAQSIMEKDVLPAILKLISVGGTTDGDTSEFPADASPSPLLQGQAQEAMLELFATYARLTNKDAGIRLVAQLFGRVSTNGKLSSESAGSAQAYPTVAKAVGVILAQNSEVFAYFAPEFRQPFEKKNALEGQIYLTLLTVGEAGRTIDQKPQAEEWNKLFEAITRKLEHSVEQIKTAAAFALGNIAVGNIDVFLPQLVQGVTEPQSAALSLLYLHALKETIEHCNIHQIEGIADNLWEPLLGSEVNEQDDGACNIRATCIGKLATARPSVYLPQLHSRIRSRSVTTRVTIAAAIRYALVDTAKGDDSLLSSLILDFLLLMEDPDYNVRRLAVTSLNAAAANKPEVVQPHLPALLPALFQETVKKPELLREYLMGPFKVVQDEGLNNRKAAYETFVTLIKTCLNQLDRNQLLDRVIEGLADEDEVKVICCVLLQRLLDVAPTLLLAKLDAITDRLKPVMEPLVMTKDTVAQDVRRKEEVQKAGYRAIAPIHKASFPSGSNKFNDWVSANSAKWREFAV